MGSSPRSIYRVDVQTQATTGAFPLYALISLSLLVASPAVAGSGGPDSWGYTWADSWSGGPSINYLLAPGSPLGLADDDSATFSLGFTFEFYGIDYTQVTVQSNGGLVFGSSGYLSFSNSCPLSYSGDLAAVFWDDLNRASGYRK